MPMLSSCPGWRQASFMAEFHRGFDKALWILLLCGMLLYLRHPVPKEAFTSLNNVCLIRLVISQHPVSVSFTSCKINHRLMLHHAGAVCLVSGHRKECFLSLCHFFFILTNQLFFFPVSLRHIGHKVVEYIKCTTCQFDNTYTFWKEELNGCGYDIWNCTQDF